jgi:hypothetical protein
LFLNGFVYDTLSDHSPLAWRSRLKWLRLQPTSSFSPQPYEQLAKVLRATGHESEAIKILIAKQKDRRRFGGLTIAGKFWNWVLGITISHGYRPHQALVYALGFILFGWWIFYNGYIQGLITPINTQSHPAFNAFIYSLDLFTPIIKLFQKDYWILNDNSGNEISFLFLKIRFGIFLQYYYCLHILAGWGITTLWVAGFTGLVRRLN